MAEDEFSPAATARHVLRLAATGSLGTLADDGAPFASLVTVATSASGEPVMLLSDLALHTRNLTRDPRASLLLVAPGGEKGDPLAGARLTVSGTATRDDGPALRRRFIARHEEAAGYAGFADFGIWRLAVEGAHLVAGFGRIVALDRTGILVDLAGRDDLVAVEAGAVAHMNADHADTLRLYATALLGLPDGDWRATGADPDGLDLRAGPVRGRLDFPEPIASPGDLRRVLADLAQKARTGAASS
jgi:heme oxygenase (biliverdin-IX-beta and delta-forming)